MAYPRILGLSIGSQKMGLIVLEKGRLLEWQMKKFDGPWSAQKYRAIHACIKEHLVHYSVSHIAIKVPSKATRSLHLVRAWTQIELLCGKAGIGCSKYTLERMMLAWVGHPKATKKELMQCLVALFPDLHTEYLKELRIGNRHYEKLFEALAAADLARQELQS